MDLDDCEFTPPLDVARQPLNDYPNWTQVIRVESVGEDSLANTRLDTPFEPTARVTVTIRRSGAQVYTMSWIASAPKPPLTK
jgi:hypothetical protein